MDGSRFQVADPCCCRIAGTYASRRFWWWQQPTYRHPASVARVPAGRTSGAIAELLARPVTLWSIFTREAARRLVAGAAEASDTPAKRPNSG